jgi:hypothetical protein
VNEIELVNLFLPASQKQAWGLNSGRNTKIEKLINNLKATRELCRDKRADLYVRASIHLISAYYFEYNLNYRYLTNDIIDKSLDSRRKKLRYYKKTIQEIYKETLAYEHRTDDDLEKRYHSVMEDLKIAERKLKRKIKLTTKNVNDVFLRKFSHVDVADYEQHTKLNKISSAIHNFSSDEIKRIAAKWDA